MSELIQIKSLIVANLDVDVRVKKGVLDLLNAIDNDLNVGGYEPSSDVDAALANLDKALIQVDEEAEMSKTKVDEISNEDEEEVDHGFKERERLVDEDDDEEKDDSR